MPPIPIQLAVQGGGAKLCALMAAMEAVQRLEEEGVLRVTRLAGTSAGSIAASLYAAGHDFSVLRTRARDNRHRLRKLLPGQSSRLVAALKMLAGRQLWSMNPLRLILNDLFKSQDVENFGHLRAKGRELGSPEAEPAVLAGEPG